MDRTIRKSKEKVSNNIVLLPWTETTSFSNTETKLPNDRRRQQR
jgi:hypothetical protein